MGPLRFRDGVADRLRGTEASRRGAQREQTCYSVLWWRCSTCRSVSPWRCRRATRRLRSNAERVALRVSVAVRAAAPRLCRNADQGLRAVGPMQTCGSVSLWQYQTRYAVPPWPRSTCRSVSLWQRKKRCSMPPWPELRALGGYVANIPSTTVSAASIAANPSRSSPSVMHSGGLVKNVFQRTTV